MSIKRPGGLITDAPITPDGPFEDGAASGVWSLQEALEWKAKDVWPIAGNAFSPVIFIGGNSDGTGKGEIDYVNPTTTGNATKWTDLTTETSNNAGCSNSTRALWSPISNDTDMIQYIDYSSGGGGSDFGAAVQDDTVGCGALSNSTRGVFAAGDAAAARDVISYVTISTTGAASDFGDLTIARYYILGTASATRGLFSGGEASNSPTTRVDYISIASTGNATDFGGVSPSTFWGCGAGNTTYSIFAGGKTSSDDYTNKIQRVEFATTGDYSDFGDLTTASRGSAGAGNSTRCLFGGGQISGSTRTVTIEYVAFATTSDASDFGDLTQNRVHGGAASKTQGNL
jgi:hypothetical protein